MLGKRKLTLIYRALFLCIIASALVRDTNVHNLVEKFIFTIALITIGYLWGHKDTKNGWCD